MSYEFRVSGYELVFVKLNDTAIADLCLLIGTK